MGRTGVGGERARRSGGGSGGRESCEVTMINYNTKAITFTVYSPDHSSTADQLSPYFSEVITVQAEAEVTRTYKQGDFLYFDGTTAYPNNGTDIGDGLVVLPLMGNDEIEVG